MRVCALQVPATVASVSAIPETGGCPESTVTVTTASVTDMTGSSAQVMKCKQTNKKKKSNTNSIKNM